MEIRLIIIEIFPLKCNDGARKKGNNNAYKKGLLITLTVYRYSAHWYTSSGLLIVNRVWSTWPCEVKSAQGF